MQNVPRRARLNAECLGSNVRPPVAKSGVIFGEGLGPPHSTAISTIIPPQAPTLLARKIAAERASRHIEPTAPNESCLY